MDASSKQSQRAGYVEKLEAFDPDLVTADVRKSLTSWISELSEPELMEAGKVLDVAFGLRDASQTATIFFLLETRFRDHLMLLGGDVVLKVVLNMALEQIWDAEYESFMKAYRSAETAAARERLIAGLPIPNLGIKAAHSILQAAWKVAPKEAQYREPIIHDGGPTPHLKAQSILELALMFADRVEPYVVQAERKAFNEWTRVARLVFKNKGAPPKNPIRLPGYGQSIAPLLGIGIACARAADTYAKKPTSEGNVWELNTSATWVTKTLAEKTDIETVRAFLVHLDTELCRLDIISACGKSKAPSSPVVRSLYRSEKNRLAQLSDGRFGLLQKEGRKSKWIEGSRDDVLPCIQDEEFEAAVNAAASVCSFIRGAS